MLDWYRGRPQSAASTTLPHVPKAKARVVLDVPAASISVDDAMQVYQRLGRPAEVQAAAASAAAILAVEMANA